MNIVKDTQVELLKTYDWVIFSDTDEFIIFRHSNDLTSIAKHLSKQTAEIIRCIGVDVIDTGNAAPLDWIQPILQQRPKGIISNWSCKSLITSVPCDWQAGFHTTNTPSTVDQHFWLFHLKYADQDHLMQRLAMTRQFQWGEESLAHGYGGSHRVADDVMINHLNHYRANTAHGTLDDFLVAPYDINHVSSPLMDIPQDFISLF